MSIDLNNSLIIKLMELKSKLEDDSQLDAFLVAFYPSNPAAARDTATYVVDQWLRSYNGSFSYVKNAKNDLLNTGVVQPRKLRGLLNTLRAEAIAAKTGRTFSPSKFAKNPAWQPKQPATDTGIDGQFITTGTFLIPTPNLHEGQIKIEITKPGPNSKWNGWLFISGGTAPSVFDQTHKLSRPKIGSQKPGETVKLTMSQSDPAYQPLIDWLKARSPVVTSTPAPVPPTSPAPKPHPVKIVPLEPVVQEVKPEPTPAPEPETVNIRDLVKKRYGL